MANTFVFGTVAPEEWRLVDALTTTLGDDVPREDTEAFPRHPRAPSG